MTFITLDAAAGAMALTTIGHILSIIVLAASAASSDSAETRVWCVIGMIATFASIVCLGITALYVRQLAFAL